MEFVIVILVLVTAVSFISCWQIATLPSGYSLKSRTLFRLTIVGANLLKYAACVGSYLGMGSKIQLIRKMTNRLEKYCASKSKIGGIAVRDTLFDGVLVRVYRPVETRDDGETLLPGIVYYHGGSSMYGSIDATDAVTRRLCKDTKSVVVSVDTSSNTHGYQSMVHQSMVLQIYPTRKRPGHSSDQRESLMILRYRLTPEFPFPAAVTDCAVAAKYFLANAVEFSVDERRVAVAGDSAGANLATVTSQKLRDDRFPIPVRLQVLIYPDTQVLDFDLPSMTRYRNGPLLTRNAVAYSSAVYTDGSDRHAADFCANRHVVGSVREKMAQTFLNLDRLPKEFLEGYERPRYSPEGGGIGGEGGGGGGGGGDDRVWNEVRDRLLDPYISPLAAEDLRNLPETFVLTANHDPLRDEGWLYAVRLKEADNRVTHYNAETGFHGMFSFVGTLPEVEPMFAEIIDFIRANL